MSTTPPVGGSSDALRGCQQVTNGEPCGRDSSHVLRCTAINETRDLCAEHAAQYAISGRLEAR